MNATLSAKALELLSKTVPNSLRLRFLSYLPRMEAWRREHAERCVMLPDRFALYKYLQEEQLEAGPIDYLEFGVYKGETLQAWTELNTDARSRFWGFDTFTGLPEPWENFNNRYEKHHFDARGAVPDIDDTRVEFLKGLFQDTLPPFLESTELRSPIVLHNDSDLYSSTLFVLSKCDSVLVPGTILIFDEFSSVMHEFRALEDYCSAFRRSYELLAATKSPGNYFDQVALRLQ